MNAEFVFESAGFQLLGTRTAQNDSYRRSGRSAFVADGVGSAKGARETADAAVHFYTELAKADFTVDDLLHAPDAFSRCRAGEEGATTLAGAILDGDRLWLIAHGDSTYLHVRDGELLGRNTPHNEAGLLASLGMTAPKTAATALTRALASRSVGDSQICVSPARLGDIIVLMTDGFTSVLPVADAVALASRGANASDLLDELLRAAAQHSPDDNATCVVARVVVASSTNTDERGDS